MRTELAGTTQTLLREIRDRKMFRRDVAKTYALALQSSESTDWRRVNRAILRRWSWCALGWIKRQAWSGKCFAADGTIKDVAKEPER